MNTPETYETEWLCFRASTIHGLGAFAQRPIPRSTRVIEYLGEKIDKATSLLRCEQNNEFIFSLDSQTDIDGNVPWNPARWINHSCAPNCEAEVDDGHIWVIARRDIEAGEEVTFNYGYNLEDYRDYPCRCGSPGCVGFMVAEEFFELVRRQGAAGEQP